MWQQVDFIWPFQLHFPPAELQLTIERQMHPRLRSYIKFEVLVVVALMLMVIVSNPSETRNNII